MLLLEFGAREPGQAAQRHVQDMVRLDLGELELVHELAACLLGVLRAADHLDDRVEVVEGDQQAPDDVVALLGLPELVARAPGNDLDLVVDVVADHFGEVQRARHAVDEREHDHAETVLQLRVLVELVEDHLRVRAALELHHQAHALAPTGVVLHVGDVPQPAGAHELGDLLREAGLVHLVRELGHDDALPPVGPLLDGADRANLDRATPGLVRFPEAFGAHHDGARREVGALDELHQVLRLRLGVVDEVHDGVDHLAEVVRRDVRRHPHRDPARAIDQQIRETRGQYGGLHLVAVVVRDEVDGLGLDVAQQLERDGRQARLGVAHRRRGVAVDRAEVPVRVHERVPQREVLSHPHQRVVHGLEPVGVVLLDDLADRPRRLPVRTVGPQAALQHRPQDPAVNGLQPVTDVGQRTPDDDRHRVVEVGPLDLLLEPDGFDPAREQRQLAAAPASRPAPRHRGSERPSRWSRSSPSAPARPRPSGS